jgi:hypothetical protein
MKIVVKCNRLYFLRKKNRKILTNRNGNLILIGEYESLLAVKEGEGRSRPKGTETLAFGRDEREKNGMVSCDRRERFYRAAS